MWCPPIYGDDWWKHSNGCIDRRLCTDFSKDRAITIRPPAMNAGTMEGRMRWAVLMIALGACAQAGRAWDAGCAIGDAIGFDNGNLDANLCLAMAEPHLPFLPIARNRHEDAVIEGFIDCYYDAYVDGYLDTAPMISCD
jgi:hypothetical protein